MGLFVRLRLLLVVGASVLGLLACADTETFVGETPPATGAGGGPFNPGPPPSSGSGTGTGTGTGAGGASTSSSTVGSGGGGGEGGQACADAQKRCPHTFTHPSGPTSVELRGDFAPDGWTNGIPLALVGGTWQVDVLLTWNTPVEYKFLLDGTTWVTDPGNPNQVDDGLGGMNSYLGGMTCANWVCAR